MFLRVLQEMSKNHWAMERNAFDGLRAGVSGDWSMADYALFHKLDEEVKASTLSFLGTRVADSRYSRKKEGIGSLFIDGPIIPRATAFSSVSGVTSVDVLTDEYRSFAADRSINKILLVIDSPGGSVTGISELVQILSESEKPIEAINLGMMASAAYWIGSTAQKIYSVDTGLVGSIGTILSMPNPDTDTTVITSSQSPNKNMDVTTEAGLADAQRIVDDLAAIFINSVAKNRGVKTKVVLSQYGRGSVFVAQDAFIRGMIDGVVSLKDYMSLGSEIKDLSTSGTIKTSADTMPAYTQETKSRKVKSMDNLETIRLENPIVDAEIKKIEAATFKEGVASLESKIKAVTPFITSSEYGSSIKALACKVIEGRSELAALEGAVAVLDEQKEQKELEAAVSDSEELGESNSGGGSKVKGDDFDFEASVAEQKLQL